MDTALGPVATSIFQSFLEATDPIRPQEAVDNSISSASSLRTWESYRQEFLAIGLVEERRVGSHPHYIGTLTPWWTLSRSNAPISAIQELEHAPEEHHALFEIATELGLDLDPDLFEWADSPPDLSSIYIASELIRRWRPLIASAFSNREDLLSFPPPNSGANIILLGRPPGAPDPSSVPDAQHQLSDTGEEISSPHPESMSELYPSNNP